jgi:hypothetical protein
MAVILEGDIQWKYGTEAEWATDPVLDVAEAGVMTDGDDAGKFKLGDGSTPWSSLEYFSPGAAGGAADGIHLQWKYNSDTSPTAAAGEVRFNNAVPGSATSMYIHVTSATATLGGEYIAGLAAGDGVYLQAVGDSTKWIYYKVSGTPSLSSNVWSITMQSVTSNGTFVNGEDYNVVLIPIGRASSAHVHDASAIVSGTFENARVSQSSVTQHQGALQISESQITDLDHNDPTAVHTDSAGEINGVALKATPASSDVLLIEDSADSFNKKKITIDSLPSGGGGVTDHGALTGLTDDDHTQYARLNGRSGGQTLTGGTGDGEDLVLQSTSHANKGTVDIHNGRLQTNMKLAGNGFTMNFGVSGTVALRDIVHMTGDNTIAVAQADSEANAKGLLAVALEGATAPDNIDIVTFGRITGFTGLTPGAVYYLDASTAGAITTTPPSTTGQIVRVVGYAENATTFHFRPSEDYGEVA